MIVAGRDGANGRSWGRIGMVGDVIEVEAGNWILRLVGAGNRVVGVDTVGEEECRFTGKTLGCNAAREVNEAEGILELATSWATGVHGVGLAAVGIEMEAVVGMVVKSDGLVTVDCALMEVTLSG